MLFLLQCERRLEHAPKSLSEAGSMPNWWPVDIRYEDETLRLSSPKGVRVYCRRKYRSKFKEIFIIVNCKPSNDIDNIIHSFGVEI